MTVIDAPNGDLMMCLPYELLEAIFQYLSPADLCKLAVCCRSWRCALNQDFWWRPLCRRNGWEYYYSTLTDISKEIPYEPQQTCDGSEVNGKTTFPMDAIVREGNPTGLPSTCKWKEIYLKARHLEGNLEHNRCHVTTLKVFGDEDLLVHHARQSGRPHVRCSDGDGDLFTMSFSDGTIKVWDVRKGICERVFRAVLSGRENTVKVQKGIVVAGCTEGMLRAFSVSSGQELPPMKGHKKMDIQCIFFDGDMVVSQAVSDDDIRVWTVSDGICRHVLASPDSESKLKDVDYRGKIVAAIYCDKQLRVWHARSGRCVHASKQTDHLQSLKLGYGTVASLHQEPGPTGVVVRSVETGECTSIPIDDFEMSVSHVWIQNYFVNGGLFLRALPHRNYEGAYLTRNRDVHFLAKFGHLKTVFCFHGNRCVLEDRYDYKRNVYHIYKASVDGFKLLRTSIHEEDQSGKRLTLWMDDTKIIFQNLVKDMNLYVHHYW
ncbi:F-box/WD repeat-containing protein 7-like [Patiria miniata]|uniref:F-box domain-containing protein n=1 Tax=Patiria miniata TaxID=46514 RepID=A0A914BPT8_PATMI|nr:F-box/WD repeat-containing protein 7-like [Patiria miniata]XP_038077970.1 F-box/WD repeat-containing protein 7-like [Patiria miniata]